MLPPEAEYLRSQIVRHISVFFDDSIAAAFESGIVRFIRQDEIPALDEKIIAIPCDIPVPPHRESPYSVEFNGTRLTLWNRLAKPDGGWHAIPGEAAPLWYQNRIGTLIPAWNLFGNLFDLLTFGEEIRSRQRDPHGRFIAAFSPRFDNNLLEVPAFNEAVAALVGAIAGLRQSDEPHLRLDNTPKPPSLVLSHDCDILMGNDFWTQAVRASRVASPLLRFRLPKIDNIWWLIRNAVTPRRFYFDNGTGMIDIERCFGFSSTYYMLNGNRGRFGARSTMGAIREMIRCVPSDWDIGMHYNYNTFLDDRRFDDQKSQLDDTVGTPVTVGRAHYLKFDPEKSLPFLARHGITVDESAGFADRIGYRNGIAGCFQAYDQVAKKPLDIYEIPLMVMDAVLVDQYGDGCIDKFAGMLSHLTRIGGAVSIVFHPGEFFNPEYRPMLGIYHRMLMAARGVEAVSKTAATLAGEFKRYQTQIV